jgi:hypothetical protein
VLSGNHANDESYDRRQFYDPIIFAVASISWFLVASVASYIPARRVAKVDSMAALGYE